MRFNDPKGPFSVFLLSTGAGGLGINLTAATVVVFFDESLNPQVVRIRGLAQLKRVSPTYALDMWR